MAWSCFELAARQERHCESLLVCSFCSVSLIRVISALVFLHHSGKIRAIFWCYFSRKKKNDLPELLGTKFKGEDKDFEYFLIAGILGNKPGPKLCDFSTKTNHLKTQALETECCIKGIYPQLSGSLWQYHIIETGTCQFVCWIGKVLVWPPFLGHLSTLDIFLGLDLHNRIWLIK